MDDQRERDQFERIRLHQDIERAQLVIGQYQTGLAYYHRQIEDAKYELGRIDERLGDAS